MKDNQDQDTVTVNSSSIPPGYSLIKGPNNQSVLVPTFLVPATETAMKAHKICTKINADGATGGVQSHPSRNRVDI